MGGLELSETEDDFAERGVPWMLAWLGAQPGHDKHYHPQPYDQLAQTLQSAGEAATAAGIQYNQRDHQRAVATGLTKVWPTIHWFLTGYGYENWKALMLFIALVVLGSFLCSRADQTAELQLGHRFWFSLDWAVPIMDLGTGSYVKMPTNWLGIYFHVHRIVGFILVTFIVAGLSGIAK